MEKNLEEMFIDANKSLKKFIALEKRKANIDKLRDKFIDIYADYSKDVDTLLQPSAKEKEDLKYAFKVFCKENNIQEKTYTLNDKNNTLVYELSTEIGTIYKRESKPLKKEVKETYFLTDVHGRNFYLDTNKYGFESSYVLIKENFLKDKHLMEYSEVEKELEVMYETEGDVQKYIDENETRLLEIEEKNIYAKRYKSLKLTKEVYLHNERVKSLDVYMSTFIYNDESLSEKNEFISRRENLYKSIKQKIKEKIELYSSFKSTEIANYMWPDTEPNQEELSYFISLENKYLKGSHFVDLPAYCFAKHLNKNFDNLSNDEKINLFHTAHDICDIAILPNILKLSKEELQSKLKNVYGNYSDKEKCDLLLSAIEFIEKRELSYNLDTLKEKLD